MKPLPALVVGFVLLASSIAAESPRAQPRYVVSFPHVKLPIGARIMGLGLELRDVFVVSVNGIPLGWSLNVRMDPSCCPTLIANAHRGAEALSTGEDLSLKVSLQTVSLSGATEPPTVQASIDYTLDFKAVKTMRVPVEVRLERPEGGV